MLKRFRNYIIGDAIAATNDSFEAAKIEMFFNIALVSSLLYALTSLPQIYNKYWYTALTLQLGAILLVSIFYSLKRSQSYITPSFLFMATTIFVSVSACIINGGQASFGIFGLAIVIIPFMFLMLPKFGGYFYLFFVIVFVFISISITYGYLSPIDIGIDFSHDRAYYRSPNIFVTMSPAIVLIYLLYEFRMAEQKARRLLIEQKEIAVENNTVLGDKNKSINENIDYASQIQRAILPKSAKIDEAFEENFILFKPVDQLSGDLYWINKKDDLSYFAVIDSSESGVSGALISFICYNALNQAINEMNLKQPAEILDYLQNYFDTALSREKRKEEICIAICSYDKVNSTLIYAGEHNPIYIIKNKNLIEYKAQFSNPNKLKGKRNYKNQKISLEQNDIIYIFSNGYANQNKSMTSEKLKSSVFKQLLLSVSNESMPVQKKMLETKLKEWLNYDLQSDDICILGLKVP